MDSFLDKFYVQVDDWLSDAGSSKRVSKSKKRRDLRYAEVTVFEDMLRASGQESTVSRAEATISLVADQTFYPLPGNFRQFLAFELWEGGDRERINGKLNSIQTYEADPGVEILSAQQGMLVRPTPSEADDWTLIYQKGPIFTHNATAKAISEYSIEFDTPGAEDGDLISIDNYYCGATVEVYDADKGAPQAREVVNFKAFDNKAMVRHPFSPVPTGTVKYQIRPLMQDGYDDVYSILVAMRNTSKRRRKRHWNMLRDEYREALRACRSYWQRNVADRAPRRPMPNPTGVDPYEEY